MNWIIHSIYQTAKLSTSCRRLLTKGQVRFLSREKPRVNEVGIQYLSGQLQRKVFPKVSAGTYLKNIDQRKIEVAEEHLRHHGLLGKKTQVTDPITIKGFPSLQGNNTLDEHFHRLGSEISEPYLSMAERFLGPTVVPPRKPDASEWLFKEGWVRYAEGEPPRSVPHPLESAMVFDVEVLYKLSHYPVLATCMTLKAWYGWVSKSLIQYKEHQKITDWNFLIPLDTLNEEKLIIGYNVSYDRARILEEYNIKQSKAFFLDGMSLHVATSGICSQQRPKWLKHKKIKSELDRESDSEPETAISLSGFNEMEKEFFQMEVANELKDDPWLSKGSPNSLANVADFHCNIRMDKSERDYFSTEDPSVIIKNFNNLMDYCAADVDATYSVTSKLLPKFKEKNPHPVSFAALKDLGTLILPTTTRWNDYLKSAEDVYAKNRENVSKILKDRANDYVRYITENDSLLKPNWEDDEHLSQLNWAIKEPRLKKNGEPVAKQAFLTGYPEWYRDIFKSELINGKKEKVMNITVRTRITPLLLKLKWEGYPLFWTDSVGWCFKVPSDEKICDALLKKNYAVAKLDEDEFEKLLPLLRDGPVKYELFKVPHADGPSKRCTSVLSKNYLRYFEDGTLTSEYSFVQEILTLNNIASYWMGNRQRIMDQFVVFSDPEGKKNDLFANEETKRKNPNLGIILPKLCTMGTITRRATENTWLTASNCKKNRIGSELKAMIQAPEGYSIVGADVDSEELWIAALIGDSMLGFHGSTALGWMTLEGNKNEKTDLHSKTAEILGILRNDAKVFNYGRIYGAGAKFATRLLKQCNASLTDEEADQMAKKLYASTKGESTNSAHLDRKMYYGGTESIMFNVLEAIASQDQPKTPTLGASIADALQKKNLNKNGFLTSRVNWVIQSSGVDYLHLLIVSMNYLIKKYNVDARLMLTVHDELRYLVKYEDRYKAALLLQTSNVWTRAMFCQQLGMNELPQSCAFFSEVDIDRVLRKDVNLDCVTPSQPIPIKPGESYDIKRLLEIFNNGGFLDRPKKLPSMNEVSYNRRTRSIVSLDEGLSTELKLQKIRLQNSSDKASWRKNISEYIKLKAKQDSPMASFSPKKKKRKKKLIEEEYDIAHTGDTVLAEELALAASNGKPSTIPMEKSGKLNRIAVASSQERNNRLSGNVRHFPSRVTNGYLQMLKLEKNPKRERLDKNLDEFQENEAFAAKFSNSPIPPFEVRQPRASNYSYRSGTSGFHPKTLKS